MTMQHPTPLKLAAYADAELTPAEAHEITRHLHSCEECRNKHRQLQILSGTLQEFAVPCRLEKDLWARIAPELAPQAPQHQYPSIPSLRWLPALALVATNIMVQAILVMTLLLGALRQLGLFNLRQVAPPLLLDRVPLLARSMGRSLGYLLSRLVRVPFITAISVAREAGGAGAPRLITSLMPIVVALGTSLTLAIIYLGVLIVSHRVETGAATQTQHVA